VRLRAALLLGTHFREHRAHSWHCDLAAVQFRVAFFSPGSSALEQFFGFAWIPPRARIAGDLAQARSLRLRGLRRIFCASAPSANQPSARIMPRAPSARVLQARCRTLRKTPLDLLFGGGCTPSFQFFLKYFPAQHAGWTASFGSARALLPSPCTQHAVRGEYCLRSAWSCAEVQPT
jgi:hypothetical protein